MLGRRAREHTQGAGYLCLMGLGHDGKELKMEVKAEASGRLQAEFSLWYQP